MLVDELVGFLPQSLPWQTTPSSRAIHEKETYVCTYIRTSQSERVLNLGVGRVNEGWINGDRQK